MNSIRSRFQFLNRKVHGNPLVYLDNAATTQKPNIVLNAIQEYYINYNANVHRGIHTLSQEATIKMEESRQKVKEFIHAKEDYECIFTSGVTHGINLLASGLTSSISKNDEIIITELDHHSNIVPWQMLCKRTGAKLKYIPILENGTLDLKAYKSLLSTNTKLVVFNHVSNALGVVNPIEELIALAHKQNALVVLDAAQSIAHYKIDVQKLDVDFLVFSAHKMYGPTGVGIFYGKEHLLNRLDPLFGGGEMIKEVEMECSTYAGLPFKFEAGTPNICGNIALGKAIEFIEEIGFDEIQSHENKLLNYATEQLSKFPEIEIYAKDIPRAGVVSFNLKLEGVHPSDVGLILDKKGIAVRTGHHCAQPIMKSLGIQGTVRASFAIYNTKEEIDLFIKGIETAIRLLA